MHTQTDRYIDRERTLMRQLPQLQLRCHSQISPAHSPVGPLHTALLTLTHTSLPVLQPHGTVVCVHLTLHVLSYLGENNP